MSRIYKLKTHLSPSSVLNRIEELLSHEEIGFTTNNNCIVSTKIPFALLGFESALYTRKNFTGLNPFVFTSAVKICTESQRSGSTIVTVSINRRRAILWFSYFFLISLVAAGGVPRIEQAVTLVIVVSLATWMRFVEFLGGYLVSREISSTLKRKGP